MSDRVDNPCPECGAKLLAWEEPPLFGEETKVYFYCVDCRFVEGSG